MGLTLFVSKSLILVTADNPCSSTIISAGDCDINCLMFDDFHLQDPLRRFNGKRLETHVMEIWWFLWCPVSKRLGDVITAVSSKDLASWPMADRIDALIHRKLRTRCMQVTTQNLGRMTLTWRYFAQEAIAFYKCKGKLFVGFWCISWESLWNRHLPVGINSWAHYLDRHFPAGWRNKQQIWILTIYTRAGLCRGLDMFYRIQSLKLLHYFSTKIGDDQLFISSQFQF